LDWSNKLNQLGIATFLVQSFAGREVQEVCAGRSSINIASVVTDAYRAFDVLAAHPRINPSHIAIMGFSFGGRTALWTNQTRFQERCGSADKKFAAHLAFYPTGCLIELAVCCARRFCRL